MRRRTSQHSADDIRAVCRGKRPCDSIQVVQRTARSVAVAVGMRTSCPAGIEAQKRRNPDVGQETRARAHPRSARARRPIVLYSRNRSQARRTRVRIGAATLQRIKITVVERNGHRTRRDVVFCCGANELVEAHRREMLAQIRHLTMKYVWRRAQGVRIGRQFRDAVIGEYRGGHPARVLRHQTLPGGRVRSVHRLHRSNANNERKCRVHAIEIGSGNLFNRHPVKKRGACRNVAVCRHLERIDGEALANRASRGRFRDAPEIAVDACLVVDPDDAGTVTSNVPPGRSMRAHSATAAGMSSIMWSVCATITQS